MARWSCVWPKCGSAGESATIEAASRDFHGHYGRTHGGQTMPGERRLTPVAEMGTPTTGNPNSVAAAISAWPAAGSKREAILEMLAARPATDDEIEARTGWPHQTVSAARNTLAGYGWLVAAEDNGAPLNRRTRTGQLASVWTLSPAARDELTRGRA